MLMGLIIQTALLLPITVKFSKCVFRVGDFNDYSDIINFI